MSENVHSPLWHANKKGMMFQSSSWEDWWKRVAKQRVTVLESDKQEETGILWHISLVIQSLILTFPACAFCITLGTFFFFFLYSYGTSLVQEGGGDSIHTRVENPQLHPHLFLTMLKTDNHFQLLFNSYLKSLSMTTHVLNKTAYAGIIWWRHNMPR